MQLFVREKDFTNYGKDIQWNLDITNPGYNELPGITNPGYNELPGITNPGYNELPGITNPGYNELPGITNPGYNELPGITNQMSGLLDSALQTPYKFSRYNEPRI